MEELLSTEALDNEILEDARKKAFKILKTADDTLEEQSRDWEKKIEESLQSIRDVYRRRVKNSEVEILARLPLDKRRMRSEISESSLSKAMREFLLALKRETLLSILENEISKRLEDFNCGGAVVKFSGLNLSEAKGILKKVSLPADLKKGSHALYYPLPFSSLLGVKLFSKAPLLPKDLNPKTLP